MHKYFVMQHDQSDCGAACLAMVLGSYGRKLPLSVIRMDLKTDINGSSIYGILTGAKKHGLEGKALCGTIHEFIEEYNNNNIQLPVIANVASKEGNSHFIVIHKITKNHLYILDPAKKGYREKIEELEKIWVGNIIVFTDHSKVEKIDQTKGRLQKYIKVCQRQHKAIISVVAFSLLISFVGLIGSIMFEYVVNGIYSEKFLQGDYSVSEEHNSPLDVMLLKFIIKLVPSFPALVIAIIFMFLLQELLSVFRSYLLAKMSKKINTPILIAFYEHVLKVPYDFFSGRKSGDVITRFSDASSVCQSISSVMLTILIDGTLAVVYGLFLLMLSPLLFLIVVVNLMVYGIVIYAFRDRIKNNQMEIMSKNAEVNTFLKESVVGIKTIKQLRYEETTIKKIFTKFNSLIDRYVVGTLLSSFQSSIVGFVSSASMILLLWGGVWLCVNKNMFVGSLITFYIMMGSFTTPVKRLLGLQPQVQTIFVSAERLEDAFSIDKEAVYTEDTEKTESGRTIDELEISNLMYAYGFNAPTMNGLSFKIKKGESVAILGKNGCGKTTFANILTGIVYPEKIDIAINNTDLSFDEYRKLTKKIAYIPQESFFFSDTIYNNITYGIENVDPEKLKMLLTKCKLADYLSALPRGVDTILEEGADNLSAGTKQKLAVVRALLRDPEVVILDEAMSNVDSESEKEIYSLLREMSDRIAIIDISHKIKDLSVYEHVLDMNHGILTELQVQGA